MKITCDSCHTRFNLADAQVPATGAKVRCSRCGHRFRVDPPPAASPPSSPPAEAQTESPVAGASASTPSPLAAGPVEPEGPTQHNPRRSVGRLEPDLENPEFLFDRDAAPDTVAEPPSASQVEAPQLADAVALEPQSVEHEPSGLELATDTLVGLADSGANLVEPGASADGALAFDDPLSEELAQEPAPQAPPPDEDQFERGAFDLGLEDPDAVGPAAPPQSAAPPAAPPSAMDFSDLAEDDDLLGDLALPGSGVARGETSSGALSPADESPRFPLATASPEPAHAEQVGDPLPAPPSPVLQVLAALVCVAVLAAGGRASWLHAVGPDPGPPSARVGAFAVRQLESFFLRDADDRRVLVVRGVVHGPGLASESPLVSVVPADATGEPVGPAAMAYGQRVSDVDLHPIALRDLADGFGPPTGRPGFTAVIRQPPAETERVQIQLEG